MKMFEQHSSYNRGLSSDSHKLCKGQARERAREISIIGNDANGKICKARGYKTVQFHTIYAYE